MKKPASNPCASTDHEKRWDIDPRMSSFSEKANSSLDVFEKEFQPYYQNLDDQVAETARYVAIEKGNEKAYSIEYSKLLQAICGEIDVFAKAVCHLDDNSIKLSKYGIQKWGFHLQRLFPNIESVAVRLSGYGSIEPWKNWKYEECPNKNGRRCIRLVKDHSTPDWWTSYNKVKHGRTRLSPVEEDANYKRANQANVLRALAALFILENLYLKEANSSDLLQSKLFELNQL